MRLSTLSVLVYRREGSKKRRGSGDAPRTGSGIAANDDVNGGGSVRVVREGSRSAGRSPSPARSNGVAEEEKNVEMDDGEASRSRSRSHTATPE